MPYASLRGMGGDHRVTGVVEQNFSQKMVGFLPGEGAVGLMVRQFLLNRIEQVALDDRRLLTRQDLSLVLDLTNKEPVAQNVGEHAPAEGDAADQGRYV